MLNENQLNQFLLFCEQMSKFTDTHLKNGALQYEYTANRYISLKFIHEQDPSIVQHYINNSILNDFVSGDLELYLDCWTDSQWDEWKTGEQKGQKHAPLRSDACKEEMYIMNAEAIDLVNRVKSFPKIKIIVFPKITFFSDSVDIIDGSNVFLECMFARFFNATVMASKNITIQWFNHPNMQDDIVTFSNCTFKPGWSKLLKSSNRVRFLVGPEANFSELREIPNHRIELWFQQHGDTVLWNTLPTNLSNSLDIEFFNTKDFRAVIVNDLLERLKTSSLQRLSITTGGKLVGTINMVKLVTIVGSTLTARMFNFRRPSEFGMDVRLAITMWEKNHGIQSSSDILEYQEELIDAGLSKYAK